MQGFKVFWIWPVSKEMEDWTIGLPYFHYQKGGHLFNEIYQQLVVLHRLYGKRQTKVTIILAIGQSVIITSVRRILERGEGGRKFEKNEDQKKKVFTQI